MNPSHLLPLVALLLCLIATGCASTQPRSNECPSLVMEEVVRTEELDSNHTIAVEWLRSQIPLKAVGLVIHGSIYGDGDPSDEIYLGYPVDELIRLRRRGDELWTYSTPKQMWETGKGERGIALVRKCRVIGSVLLRRSG